jgi:hypothetical protein
MLVDPLFRPNGRQETTVAAHVGRKHYLRPQGTNI